MKVYDKIIIKLKGAKTKLEIDLKKDNARTVWDRVGDSKEYLLSFDYKSGRYNIIDRKRRIIIEAYEDRLHKIIVDRFDILLNEKDNEKCNKISIDFVESSNENLKVSLKYLLCQSKKLNALRYDYGISQKLNKIIFF